ncbi:hypothetical protein Micbo1qcDRAFT_236501 [Microdochium bolleyi]|uniref:Zn(2)-C6 fungal-type domain-containing protein n=1 Tax=Microdochium bolleyi TaxID=196109 RepID=A0A136IR10_9PEZI|nr:hypothetical protein Micbo1qcDRAFT_236501 [Microdochium bolleyi]
MLRSDIRRPRPGAVPARPPSDKRPALVRLRLRSPLPQPSSTLPLAPVLFRIDGTTTPTSMDAEPLQDPRPVLKRTRHACDPCRRKKSKCSGDRPSCSTCARLRQRCSYPAEADDDDGDDVLKAERDHIVVGSVGEGPRDRSQSHGGQSRPPVTPSTTIRSASNGGGGQQNHHLESRLHSLESTISHVLDTLHSVSAAGALHSLSAQAPHHHTPIPATRGTARSAADENDDADRNGRRKRPRTEEQPLWRQVEAVADTYIKYCEGQPLYLFHRETFARSLRFRPDELLLAILAVTLRFKDVEPGTADSSATSGNSPDEFTDQDSLTLASKAHALVMAKIGTRAIELSTLQTLCLLAFVHFHEGNPDQSMPFVTLSMALTYGLFLHTETPTLPASVIEERRRTYWSVRLLCRFWGMAPSAFDLPGSSHALTSPYPTSPTVPPPAALRPECRTLYYQHSPGRQESAGRRGIMACTYQLGEVWSQAMIFVRQRFSAAAAAGSSSPTLGSHDHQQHHQPAHVAPWETSSQYNAIMSAFMGFDRWLPPLHRYRHLNFKDLTTHHLNAAHRDYWAPWLLSRFMYHTIIVIANHPLLVTLQLQGKGNDSELFRQQTQFYTSVHTSWIMHFIQYIESKGYEVSDPTMGYCAGVVATVELQMSFAAPPAGEGGGSGMSAAGQERRRNFEQCLRFVRGLGRRWPSMELLARKLDALTESISVSYESMAQLDTGGNIHVDISKVSDILDYATGAATSRVAPGSGLHSMAAAAGGSDQDTGASDGRRRQQWTTLVQPPSVDQPDHDASAVDFSALLLSAAAGADAVAAGGGGSGMNGGFAGAVVDGGGGETTGFGGHTGAEQQHFHHRQLGNAGAGVHDVSMMLGVDGGSLAAASGNNAAGMIPADMFFGIGTGDEAASWGAFGGF